MTRPVVLDFEREAADLLDRAAGEHELAGRADIAKHHRRAAARLRTELPAA